MFKKLVICLSMSMSIVAAPSAISKTTDSNAVDKPAEKAAADWQQSLKECEQLISKRDAARAANLYVEAIQGAEAAKVSCTNDAFVDLMAVGNSLTVVAPDASSATKTSIDSALRWKLHAALAICGQDSPAEYQAYLTLASWCMLSDKKAAAAYIEKANALLPKLESKKAEVSKFIDAGQAKAFAIVQSQFNSIKGSIDGLNSTPEKK